jgi:hypothetical protein
VMGKPAATGAEPDDPHSARDDDTRLSADPIGKLPALQPRREHSHDVTLCGWLGLPLDDP